MNISTLHKHTSIVIGLDENHGKEGEKPRQLLKNHKIRGKFTSCILIFCILALKKQPWMPPNHLNLQPMTARHKIRNSHRGQICPKPFLRKSKNHWHRKSENHFIIHLFIVICHLYFSHQTHQSINYGLCVHNIYSLF